MDKLKLPTYGGQAVIEGVMMRGKQSLAIAMRAPDDSIIVHKDFTLGCSWIRNAGINNFCKHPKRGG